MNWIQKKIRKYHEGIILWAVHDARKSLVDDIFARIGIDELEEIIEKGKENRKEKGHTDYTNLGQLYAREIWTNQPHRIEELEKENKDLNNEINELKKKYER